LKKESSWFKNGIWNTAEHASTRILDALATLLILWAVPTEKFSHLAIAQAWVAPALFLFIAPETILYRDFAKWQSEGQGSLLTRIRMLRRFAWSKVAAATILSLAIAAFSGSVAGSESTYFDRLFALIWAFSLSLAPQIAGPDRELLRIDLNLRQLNFVTFFQRALYLALLAVAIHFYGSSMATLATSAGVAVLLSAGIARFLVERNFSGVTSVHSPENSFFRVISGSLSDFSIWNHLAGIVIGWMQTMDLFFLGVFHFSALDIGLYSTILKLSNFTLAAPFAFSNLYAVHLGREHPDVSPAEKKIEFQRMFRLSGYLLAFIAAQVLIFWFASPWILSLLSRGRWTEMDIGRMIGWLDWILPSCALFGSLLLWTSWLNVRTPIRDVVIRAYLPWGVVALSVYGYFIHRFGPDGAARANLMVVALLIPLLIFATVRARGKATESRPLSSR
jgi:hypothetical protein